METDRTRVIAGKLFEYVKSPSLRHIRDPQSIQRLAQEILKAVDRAGSVWEKWDGAREKVAKAAGPCWIPKEDLSEFLNRLPGPPLTSTDVVERQRAFYAEPYASYPNDELQAGCLAIYEAEKAQGTELTAIIGALQTYIELEEERLRNEQQIRYRRSQETERIRLQQRFLAGADSGWTKIENSKAFYCRRNGRAFRIAPTKDKRWILYRINDVADEGISLGTYQGRREATKALEKIAYEQEPRW